MKVKDTIPVVGSIIVVVEGLNYKEKICTIEVACNAGDDTGTIWSPTSATCKKPYFIMGSGFWKENFGIGQANRIRKLCDTAIKDYLEKEQECETCEGVEVVSSGEPDMFNCELGGTDCPGMTNGVLDNEDACKKCGKTVPCPECMPVANKYYLLWHRDNRLMNLANQKIRKLEKELEKGKNG